jgi:hypothetical protein
MILSGCYARIIFFSVVELWREYLNKRKRDSLDCGPSAPLGQTIHKSFSSKKTDCEVLLPTGVTSMHENFEPWKVRTL